uniref:Uncharacterized protein n=1 Tax=Tetradesmus obliquus TaxID=3088 RepID=A0A383VEU7_TETOB
MTLMELDSMERSRKSRPCSGCLSMTPWAALLAAALFVAGLVMFIVGAARISDHAMQIAGAIGVAPSLASSLNSGLLTAILAISICGFSIIALVVLQGLWRLTHKLMMWGECCCSCSKPEPWLFTAYRAFGGLLNLLMWLLLLGVVACLMFMLLWLGGAVAINTAITQGTTEANSLLGPFGLSLSQASDASAAALAFLTPLVRSTDAASQLLGVTPGGNRLASYAFQPLCPPVCLNLGSFAMFLQSSSCICGSLSLNAVQKAAREGTRVGIVALAGAFAMYVAATLLLIVLTGHYVEARFDRSTARRIKRKTAEQYENGFAADPEDCIDSDADSATIAVSTTAAAAAAAPGVAPAPVQMMHSGSGHNAAAAAAQHHSSSYQQQDAYSRTDMYADVYPLPYGYGYAAGSGNAGGCVAPLAAAAAAADAARGSGMVYQPAADSRRASML